jgi:hypothetical protein
MNNKSYRKYGWPLKPPIYLLKRIYEGNLPPADNFLIVDIGRYGIYRFINPFRIDPTDLVKKFGCNLDIPLDDCFEKQLNDFIEEVLKNEKKPVNPATKFLLKRMGRFGALYRHGYSPRSIRQLESERVEAEKHKQKVYNFLEERNNKRREANIIFESLPQEDQNYLQMEFEHSQAQKDPIIKARGGSFSDFLIFMLKIKITLYDEISETNKIRIRLREISTGLKDIDQKWNKDEIDFAEFAEIFKKSAKELNELDQRLKELQTSSG